VLSIEGEPDLKVGKSCNNTKNFNNPKGKKLKRIKKYCKIELIRENE